MFLLVGSHLRSHLIWFSLSVQKSCLQNGELRLIRREVPAYFSNGSSLSPYVVPFMMVLGSYSYIIVRACSARLSLTLLVHNWPDNTSPGWTLYLAQATTT
jgi:hypothetical protein